MLYLFDHYNVDMMPGSPFHRERAFGSTRPFHGLNDGRRYGWEYEDWVHDYGIREHEQNEMAYDHKLDDYPDQAREYMQKAGAYTGVANSYPMNINGMQNEAYQGLFNEDVVLTAAKDPDPRKRRMAGLAIAAALGLTTGAVGTKLMSGDKDDQRP